MEPNRMDIKTMIRKVNLEILIFVFIEAFSVLKILAKKNIKIVKLINFI